MRMLFNSLLLLFTLTSFASNENSLTEEDAEGLRNLEGIRKLTSTDAGVLYQLRTDGNFLISKAQFKTQKEAQGFCDGQEKMHLTPPFFPMLLTMQGLPFVELRSSSIISEPVLRNGRSGYIYWFSMQDTAAPKEDQLKSPRDKEIFELLKQPDFLIAFTNGDGGSSDGPDLLSRINSSLVALGKSERALPAICLDLSLIEKFK